MPKKLTTDAFISKAKQVHGDKYDYSLVHYVDASTKIAIICNEHGAFYQNPSSHLQGHGCDRCGGTHSYDTPAFITKAKEVHGDKYDYGLVEYKRAGIKVTIICPLHGTFVQAPSQHLSGQGCDRCGGTYSYDTSEFVVRAKDVHGDKYDYSRVEYVNNKRKVTISCLIHGEFAQSPNSHLMGHGCGKCAGTYLSDTHTFIARAKEVHGDKHDYSRVNYIGNRHKVAIICKRHGTFHQSPHEHLFGHGCSKCAKNGLALLFVSNTDQFIAKARDLHGYKYDYTDVVYLITNTYVKIRCSEHGCFEQVPSSHLTGRGCPICANNVPLDTAQFILKARLVHGDRYDYSLVCYERSSSKVTIICPVHGQFTQGANSHMQGNGCKYCAYDEHEGCYNQVFFDNHPEIAVLPGILYVTELTRKHEQFWKVGITRRTLEKRLSDEGYKQFEIRTVLTTSGSIYEMWKLEQAVHNDTKVKDFKYISKTKFAGRTECYKPEALLEVCEYIDNEVNGNYIDDYLDPRPQTPQLNEVASVYQENTKEI